MPFPSVSYVVPSGSTQWEPTLLSILTWTFAKGLVYQHPSEWSYLVLTYHPLSSGLLFPAPLPLPHILDHCPSLNGSVMASSWGSKNKNQWNGSINMKNWEATRWIASFLLLQLRKNCFQCEFYCSLGNPFLGTYRITRFCRSLALSFALILLALRTVCDTQKYVSLKCLTQNCSCPATVSFSN